MTATTPSGPGSARAVDLPTLLSTAAPVADERRPDPQDEDRDSRQLPWRRTAAFATAYLVTVVLGRLTVVSGTGLALFWPAAGVAALWLIGSRGRHARLADGALLLVVTTAVNVVTGAGAVVAVLFGVANLLQALVAGLLLGGREAHYPGLSAPRDLLRVGLAALAASLVSMPVGNLAAWLSAGQWSPVVAAVWVVRNAAGTIVPVSVGLTVIACAARARRQGRLVPQLTSHGRHHVPLELVTLVLATGAGGWLTFGTTSSLPLAFVTLTFSVWCGQRFSPMVASAHGALIGVVVALTTASGRGAFAGIDDLTLRVLVCQLYIVLAVTIGLLLALGQSERFRLIAELQESRAEVRSQADLLSSVTQQLQSGLLVTDAAGRTVMANPAAAGLFGTGRSGLPELTSQEFLTLDERPTTARALLDLLGPDSDGVPQEVVHVGPTGVRRVLALTSSRLSTEALARQGLRVLGVHDVTRQHAQMHELRAFAGVVAHDLRNPLTVISSWAEILDDKLDELDERATDASSARASLIRIYRAADRMQRLIDDLLTYSRSQIGSLEPTDFALEDLVSESTQDLHDLSTSAAPVIRCLGPLPLVRGDQGMVRQVVANLLGNAAKYTAPGVVPRITVEAHTDGDRVVVSVHDNGIGIAPSERHRVFDTFYRAQGSQAFGGTGLGLAICARVVERHGGHIVALEGPRGQGSTVRFDLPAGSVVVGDELSLSRS